MRVQREIVTPFFYMVLALAFRPEEHYYFFMLAPWALVGRDGKWIRAMPIPMWRNPKAPSCAGASEASYPHSNSFLFSKGNGAKGF